MTSEEELLQAAVPMAPISPKRISDTLDSGTAVIEILRALQVPLIYLLTM